jgi:hypothetical protein
LELIQLLASNPSHTVNPTHTPGPWNVSRLNFGNDRATDQFEILQSPFAPLESITPESRLVATVEPCNGDANARLIAAAPALLQALLEYDVSGSFKDPALQDRLLRTRAAIALAQP